MRIEPFLAPNLTILDTLEDGRGLARLPDTDGRGGRVVFVDGGLPGDVADVWIYGTQKRSLTGRVQTLHAPSPDRVQPLCQHFADCGGCKWQHQAYDAQLRFKYKQVVDAVERIGHVQVQRLHPILGADPQYYYRNKLEFTFSHRRWKAKGEMAESSPLLLKEGSGVVLPAVPPPSLPSGRGGEDGSALGFHVPGAFDKVLDIHRCHLQDDRINPVRNYIRDWALREGIEFFHLKEQTGTLRNLVFRTSQATGEVLLMLILAEDRPELVDRLFRALEVQFPYLTSLLWLHNPKRNDSYSDLLPAVWKGTPYLRERLFDKWFQVSPTSFFQTNTAQAERLYGVVRDYVQAALADSTPLLAKEGSGEVNTAAGGAHSKANLIYDLYCGAGSIGICLSDLTERVLGVEYVPSAVADAEVNVALNSLSGYDFLAGDLAKLLTPELVQEHGRPDVIVTDPPRAGMAEAVVRQLLKLRCPHIVYVSCNPATQARDLALLSEAYDVLDLQPVDMFPQTSHVESVARLRLK